MIDKSSVDRLEWAHQGFDGGLVTSPPSHALDGDESPDAENFDPSVLYKLFKRTGQSNFSGTHGSATGTKVRGLIAFSLEDGTQFIVAKEGTAVYNITAGNWSTTITGHPALADADEVHFCVFKNVLIMTSEESSPIAPQKWTGSGAFANLGGSPPSAKFCCVHKSKVWLMNIPSVSNGGQSQVYFSVSNNHEDWTTANSAGNFYVNPGDGMVINGCASDGDVLYISKINNTGSEGALYAVYGDTAADFKWRRIAWFGATNPRAIITTQSYVVAATQTGIYGMAGNKLIFLSNAINKTWTDLTNAQRNNAALGRYVNQIWVSYPASGSTNTKGLIFDQFYQRWSRYNPCKTRIFSTHPDGSLYGAADDAVKVRKFNTGTDDESAAISLYWYTPNLDFGSWYQDKKWSDCYLHVNAGQAVTWTVTNKINDVDAADSVSVVGNATTDPVKRLGALGSNPVGRFLSFKIAESSTSAAECYGIQIEARRFPTGR